MAVETLPRHRALDFERMLHNLKVRLFVSAEDRDDAEIALENQMLGLVTLTPREEAHYKDLTFRY